MNLRIIAPDLLLASCVQSDPDPSPSPEVDPGSGLDVGLAEETGETGAPPDLPCADLDFMTDDLNCGSCGHECPILWPGTDYEAGHCLEGQCGPNWAGFYPMVPTPDPMTCDKMCGFDGKACVPGGCSGKTGLVCINSEQLGNHCDLGDPSEQALYDLMGECDEIPPQPGILEPGFYPYLNCCCES
jgi:hypothetical protein